MTRRLPITLWLYVLADLWKLVLLTTTVLVSVIAFAAAVKPLADGKLTPLEAFQFMAFAVVPMLQYALPFAACFGATLAYHKLASENELSAAYAGGVSHRSMLVPGIVSGIVLAAILFVLSNAAIPHFLRRMAELLTQDAAKYVLARIERGEAINLDRTLIFADKAFSLAPDAEDPGTQRLWLSGLLVVRLGDNQTVESQGSAHSASVWLRSAVEPGMNSDKPTTEVIIKPKDFVGIGQGTRGMGADAITTLRIPNPFRDNPKFLTFAGLAALKSEPERMDRIDEARRDLAIILAERGMVDAVRQSLKASGQATFTDPYKQPVVLKASDLRATRRRTAAGEGPGEVDPRTFQVIPPSGTPVIVERPLAGGKTQVQRAASAYLRLPGEPDPQSRNVRATILLQKVAGEQVGPEQETVSPPDELAQAARGQAEERPLSDLSFASDDTESMTKLRTFALLRLAQTHSEQRPRDAAAIQPAVKALQARVDDLLREVMSKEHERYAMSLACLVMVLTGSVMAMRLRDAVPLAVYLGAFFPALAAVLCVSGGQQLVHGSGPIGLLLLYGGVAGLGVFAGVGFVKLAKH